LACNAHNHNYEKKAESQEKNYNFISFKTDQLENYLNILHNHSCWSTSKLEI